MPQEKIDAEITIRIVNQAEIKKLNAKYCHIDKPTNVLAFPSTIPLNINTTFLGDIIICAPIINKEATEQNKQATAHWAHITIHGILHLLGYDHDEPAREQEMRALEERILSRLGSVERSEAG